MQLEDWLDDLCVRFIINLPQEDLSSVARICFQVEEAQWFYEDFIRPLDASLPPMSLRQFCLRIFQHCPLLSSFSEADQMAAFDAFLKYKERIPVRGAIMLNEAMDAAVLVKGWKKGANWSFPRGKINKDEDDLDCAIRELWEETGYDVRAADLPLDDDHLGAPLDVIMREQHLRFYVFRNVPMDTFFEPKTRKEISKVQWYRLSDLPGSRHQRNMQRQHGTSVNVNKFYMVAKFLPILEKWIAKERSKEKHRRNGGSHLAVTYPEPEDVQTDEETAQNYMSESAAEGDISFAPASLLSSVSGTEAALKALLKIQPQTSSMHFFPGASQPTPGVNDKGDALMALLKPSAAQQQPLPQTPMDAIIREAPAPETPHHHHPHQSQPFSSMPPPPPFQLQQQYQQHLPQQTQYLQHSYQPDQFRHPQAFSNYDSQQHLPQTQQERPQDSQTQYENVRRSQSEQLRHPQPLPPQVQKAVFSGGVAHGPMIPKSMYFPDQNRTQQQPTHNHVQYHPPPAQPDFSNVHGPMITSTGRQDQAKLTSHTLGLLNAFKTKDGNDLSGHEEMMRRFEKQTLDPQELSADNTAPYHQLVNMYGPPQGRTDTTGKSVFASEHKSNLLGMFKSPTNTTAIPGQPQSSPNLLDHFSSKQPGTAPTAVMPNTIAQPLPDKTALLNLFSAPRVANNIDGPVPTELPVNPVSIPTTLQSGGSTARSAARMLSQNVLQSSSPFRPTAILARPHQDPAYVENKSSIVTPRGIDRHPTATRIGAQDRPTPSPRGFAEPPPVFQPQILKRPEPMETNPVEMSGSYSGFAQTLGNRQPTQPMEHKQNLLSLFGKGAAPESPQTMQPQLSQHSDRGGLESATRSRVGSLASASRRGSQTPVSPADKGFLLGFLNNVAKGDGH